ncbi:uncharacterized protein LOC100162748 [Acyrthosiphon pisum]|uniref:ACYPI003880 protein n=1 Tax=Acyrthosiphon pisum TaxID=7029 RepID=C4WV44_ACYPI|nr:uncharacterized protein LOC100162748 [Acyrthosiphon pisum]BAH71764.1 ACYPI003880 [Acyrthosiphon pisum]|eukprot:NP_001156149.1 uncharacterized protein LOC100162748 [Acyrthosiphon pisum]
MNTNAYPKKRNMRKRISNPIPKGWSNTNKLGEDIINLELDDKSIISKALLKTIKSEELMNKKLIANLNYLAAHERVRQAIYLKHLELKEKVLETEEKLLKLGLKTSTFSAFRITERDRTPDTEVMENLRFEKLLELETPKDNTNFHEIFQQVNVSYLRTLNYANTKYKSQ